ncbi:MAG TPA: FAD-binding oxidoreductase [Candidatus Saccharimonadales bacterium]|nr:FAD-binding oxidoreductase [Candidatus Saccharimonadales bacterium]
MSKVAHYLQEHLLGEVTDSPEVRRHFSQDASILHMAPAIVAYPRNENDIRKTARFTWQLAQRGRVMPITARGGGSNTSGSAIGSGILLVFTAHMNKILMLDAKKDFIVVEPGATYDKIEQTLYTHGLFLPPYPNSQHYATIGGGIATNAIGEKSVKYGTTSQYVENLRVVLANGEVIETGPLNKRELNRKLGLSTFEGEVYRSLDTLLEDNAELIAYERQHIKSIRNAVGYNVFDVKNKKGFDLTPLFIGSQGTLGIISEASLRVVSHNPITSMALIELNDLNDLNEVLPKILQLKPSICDMVNKSAIQLISQINPNQLAGMLDNPQAAIHLFVEFDDLKEGDQKKAIKRLMKLVDRAGGTYYAASHPDDLERLWKIRHSVSTILTHPQEQSKAVPVAEDVSVPINRLAEFLSRAAEVYESNGLVAAAWGQAGDGVVRMQPMLDLGQVGDRQKLYKVSEAIYAIVKDLDGSFSAAAGDGRIRAPYTSSMYSPEYYEFMLKVKKIFDPYSFLNPGVKTASADDIKTLMRGEYNLAHHHEHLPRS